MASEWLRWPIKIASMWLCKRMEKVYVRNKFGTALYALIATFHINFGAYMFFLLASHTVLEGPLINDHYLLVYIPLILTNLLAGFLTALGCIQVRCHQAYCAAGSLIILGALPWTVYSKVIPLVLVAVAVPLFVKTECHWLASLRPFVPEKRGVGTSLPTPEECVKENC